MNGATRSRRHPIVAIALLWAGGLTGCKSAQPDAPPTVQTLRVILSKHLSWAPLLLAKEAGYFAEAGLEIEFVAINRSEESLIALLNGEVDVLPGPLHPGLFTAVARGGDIRIVAGMNYLARDGCTYHGIVLRPGLSPAEAGRRIRRLDASRDGSARYLTSRMLATRGIEIDTLDTVKLPMAVVEHTLETGAIDGASVTEPMVTRTTRKGTLWLRSEKATPDFQWAVISFGERLLHRDPQAGARFLAAYRRGVEQYNAGKTAHNLDLLGRTLQEDRKILEESCWPAFRVDARPNMESVLAYQRWARDHRYLDQTATLSQLWDSSFVVASDAVLLRLHASHTRE